jgi:hypothetical protein
MPVACLADGDGRAARVLAAGLTTSTRMHENHAQGCSKMPRLNAPQGRIASGATSSAGAATREPLSIEGAAADDTRRATGWPVAGAARWLPPFARPLCSRHAQSCLRSVELWTIRVARRPSPRAHGRRRIRQISVPLCLCGGSCSPRCRMPALPAHPPSPRCPGHAGAPSASGQPPTTGSEHSYGKIHHRDTETQSLTNLSLTRRGGE